MKFSPNLIAAHKIALVPAEVAGWEPATKILINLIS